MLLKAAQGFTPENFSSFFLVVFDDLPGSNPRYPTDHWAGYGLSYSLPADLLKVFRTVLEMEEFRAYSHLQKNQQEDS